MRATTVAFCCVIALSVDVAAQHAVFVVRHAERADTIAGAPATMGADPDLSAAGRGRAESLAANLEDADIAAVFVTEYKRTQQTAAPFAAMRRLTPTIVPAADTAALVSRIRSTPGRVLVVGHSNTVPAVLEALVGTKVSIQDDEYDNLFIVIPGEPATVIRLRYR